MSQLINAPQLAAPVGFSHAVRHADTVYLAGQTALSPTGQIVGETMAEQFDVAAGNLVCALQAAGGQPSDLVSLQVFVTDVAEYRDALPALGPVWRRHSGRRYPAMGLFGVAALFDAPAKVELMGVAVLSTGARS
jgi:enamine deaminase RidA (YjgF/YER057c/UK114 family)